MGKITTIDLSRTLVEHNKLSQRDAETFVSNLFETIRQGLETDMQVKIKGLGTFKIIDVDARESVSVNTGERVVIDSHGKITFTPDSAMKERVNRPFSQFETIILNDGVTFDDMDTLSGDQTEADGVASTPLQTSEMLSVEETEPISVESQAETETNQTNAELQAADIETNQTTADRQEDAFNKEDVETEIKAVEPVVNTVEDGINETEETLDESEKLVINEEKPVANEEEIRENEEEINENEEETREYEEDEIADDEDEDESKNSFWKKFWRGVLIFFIIIITFVGGYLIGNMFVDIDFFESPFKVISTDSLVNESSTDGNSVVKDTLASATNQSERDTTEAIPTQKVDSTEAARTENAQPKTDNAQLQNEEASQIPDYLKYNDMDIRLRKGYYYIVDVKTIHKVNRGEDIEWITKHYLGDVGLMAYVCVFNGLSDEDTLTIGQEIKIPLLYTKKYVNERQKRQ